MKVEQDSVKFHPITITLETKEEARMLWNFIEAFYEEYNAVTKERSFLISLSNKLGEKEF